ncbi:hypothetical protein EWM64_g5757 [Hericium alpestre]|uniref:Uncharacterized protein n=1 Tax=Hericium alpestre TaxID=135208 RepID=A0A4Y9ZUI5_9AGAM|nr:hypothetical protein EWM64_g5757 [Hericium alpestre]
MSAGAPRSAIDALYQDNDVIVIDKKRWFERLENLVDQSRHHPKTEAYTYGPLTLILDTYAATWSNPESGATIAVIPQGCFEATMNDGTSTRRSPDHTITVLSKGDGDKACLLGWLEAKQFEEDSCKTNLTESHSIVAEAEDIAGHDVDNLTGIAKRLSQDLIQLCEQAFFAFHRFKEDVVYGLITYGMTFFFFKFTRPDDWARIRGTNSGNLDLPKPIVSDEEIILDGHINPRFIWALDLMMPQGLSRQPSWLQLPSDYSSDAEVLDLHIATRALKKYKRDLHAPAEQAESPENSPKNNSPSNNSFIPSSDGPSSEYPPVKAPKRSKKKSRKRSPARRPIPAQDTDAPNSEPDRIIKRMRNRKGVVPTDGDQSQAAADGVQNDTSGARGSRKRGRSDDHDGVNVHPKGNGPIQRKTGREKRPRFAQQSAADSGRASTSRAQDRGPAAAVTLGADTSDAEPETAPSEAAQEPAGPGNSHPVTGTRSATQQGEAAVAAQVPGHGGVVLRRSTRNKKPR